MPKINYEDFDPEHYESFLRYALSCKQLTSADIYRRLRWSRQRFCNKLNFGRHPKIQDLALLRAAFGCNREEWWRLVRAYYDP